MTPIGFRYALIYGAAFLGIGTFLPYFPVWLESRGLSAAEIGLVLGISGYLRLFTMPVVAYAADRAGAPVRTLRLITAATVLGNAAYLLSGSFWPILGVMVFMTLVGPPILPMTEALAMRESEAGRMDYGRVRLWGSLTFIASNVGVGALLGSLGPDVVVWVIIFSGVIHVGAYFTLDARPGEVAGLPKADLRQVGRLVRKPVFLIYIFAAGGVAATHAVYYAFGSLHWRSLGIGDTTIGMLWGLGVLAEVVLFWVSAPLMKRIGPGVLIALGAAGGIVRWGIMAFDPPFWSLPLLQCLHAATFGLSHLGAMQFLVTAVPASLAGTAQTVYAALSVGVLMSTATFLAGALYEDAGGLTYLAMAGLAVLACGAALAGRRLWDGERINV